MCVLYFHGQMGNRSKCEIFGCSELLDLAKDRQTDRQTKNRKSDRHTDRKTDSRNTDIQASQNGRMLEICHRIVANKEGKTSKFGSGKIFYAHILKCQQSYASIFTS